MQKNFFRVNSFADLILAKKRMQFNNFVHIQYLLVLLQQVEQAVVVLGQRCHTSRCRLLLVNMYTINTLTMCTTWSMASRLLPSLTL